MVRRLRASTATPLVLLAVVSLLSLGARAALLGEPDRAEALLIEGLGHHPRAGALYRSNAHGSGELIAANLSLLLVVVAPLPAPDFYIVDRYLAAAQCAGIRGRVVLNKCELGIDAITEAELRDYAALGLEPMRVSAQAASGLQELRALLHEQTAAMVGQSGVGKSSLLRALVPDSEAAIGARIIMNSPITPPPPRCLPRPPPP